MELSIEYTDVYPNFIKNFENHKFPRWLTSSQKNKHQFLIKNLKFLSHNHPRQKHEGNQEENGLKPVYNHHKTIINLL